VTRENARSSELEVRVLSPAHSRPHSPYVSGAPDRYRPLALGDGPLEVRCDPNGKNSLANDVTALAQPIANILSDIHTAAPNAKVFVVGYPDILPQNGACWPSMPFETADAEYLNSIEQDLNSMLQETAEANGATFVNTYTPSEGHNARTAESTRWVAPIVPASPADPVDPNANGEAAMASEVEQAGI